MSKQNYVFKYVLFGCVLFLSNYLNNFRDTSLSPNEKYNIENSLSQENIAKLLKNIQSNCVTYSKVKFNFKMLIYIVWFLFVLM